MKRRAAPNCRCALANASVVVHPAWVVIVWRKHDREARSEILGAADLSGRDFSRCRLMGMDLRGKRFDQANLERADLTTADLRSVDLSGANLRAAFLTGARLDGADLRDACLDGAFLVGAELRGANMDGVSMDGATWDQATVWPDRFRPPKSDATLWHGRTT